MVQSNLSLFVPGANKSGVASLPLQTIQRNNNNGPIGFGAEFFIYSNGSGNLSSITADAYLPQNAAQFFTLIVTAGESPFFQFPSNGLWIVMVRVALTSSTGSVSVQGSNLASSQPYATFSSTTYNPVTFICNVANTTSPSQNSSLTLEGGGLVVSSSVGTIYFSAYQIGQQFSKSKVGGD